MCIDYVNRINIEVVANHYILITVLFLASLK